jgi:hypothetical protein
VQTAPSPNTQKILGSSVASYGPRKRRWREACIWPLPGFILALVFIITGLDWYYYGYTQYGPIAAQSWSQNWLAWGILFGVLTLFLSTWQVYRAQVRVNLYQYGIEIKLPLRPTRSLRWEEITGITSVTIQNSIWGRTFRICHQSTLFFTQDKPITLDDRVDKLLELTTRLKANLYPRLLPDLRIRFQSGQVLTFGTISIQLNFIAIHKKQIPWEHINRITILSGYLTVEIRTQVSPDLKNVRIPVIQIPNLELLLQVLQR